MMNKILKNLNNDQGLTLVELIVAMLIVSVLAVMYASSTTTSFSIAQSAGEETTALNYARQKIEEIKSSPIKPAAVSNGSFNSKYRYTISLTNYNSLAKLYQVQVTVFYVKGTIEKNVNLKTLIYWGQ